MIGFADPGRVLWQGASQWRDMKVGLSDQRCAQVGCVLTAVAQACRILGVRAGATPQTVNDAGLKHAPAVWLPERPAAAIIPRLCRANRLACASEPIEGSAAEMREAITLSISGGGLALVHVDYTGDERGEHWILAHAVEDGVIRACDPATARVEFLGLDALSGTAKWGSVSKTYTVAKVRPIYVG